MVSYKVQIAAILIVFGLFGLGFQLLALQSTSNVYMRPIASLQDLIYEKKLPVRTADIQPTTDKNLVVIVTYMRSGSSLTGDILQHSPDAFYIYEPFRSIGKIANTSTLEYVNGTIRNPPVSSRYEMKMALYHWSTCQLRKLPRRMLMDGFLKYGLKSKAFVECMKQKGVRNKTLLMHGCVSQLQLICEQSPTIVIKTIRMSIEDTEDWLSQFPNSKIVHLIRDPRATLFSEAKFGICSAKRGGQTACVSRFCTRVENDFLSFERLSRVHENRLTQVKYEHIAKSPIEISKKMYDFLGFEFTNSAKDYIYNITLAGNPNNCLICTVRSNSTEHIDTWKAKMNKNFIEIINDRCNYIIKRFNFDIYPSLSPA